MLLHPSWAAQAQGRQVQEELALWHHGPSACMRMWSSISGECDTFIDTNAGILFTVLKAKGTKPCTAASHSCGHRFLSSLSLGKRFRIQASSKTVHYGA